MVKGRLGMIVCPMLEDEAIYNIESDSDIEKIYLADTPFNDTLIPKLKQHGVPYTTISPEDVLSGKIPSDGYSVVIWVMYIGLHEDPDMLQFEIQNQIIQMRNVVDSILLYYGRCGRGLDHIEEWAKENIPIPVSIFKNKDGTMCDDCICIPVGGTERYLQLLRKYPGRLYFTPAMASNFEGMLISLNLMNGLDVTTAEIMKMLLEMAGYVTILRVQTGLGDQEHFDENIRTFAEKYELEVLPLDDSWVSKDITDMNYNDVKNRMIEWLGDAQTGGGAECTDVAESDPSS